mgnify:CR=1 FL=1
MSHGTIIKEKRSVTFRRREKVAEKTTTGVTEGGCISLDGPRWELLEA